MVQLRSTQILIFIMICVLITSHLGVNSQMAAYYADDYPESNILERIYPAFVSRYGAQNKRGGMYGGLLGKRFYNS
ncbi:unnamed protein product [Heterobilharzia americana]|nr:unnamed protein product [Heterobilharzia americana]